MDNSIEDYILNTFNGTVHNEELQTDCFFCDKEGKFYINLRTGLSHCFVCGASMNFARLFSAIEGVDMKVAVTKADEMQTQRARNEGSLVEKLYETGDAFDLDVYPAADRVLPRCGRAYLHQDAGEYLKKRGVIIDNVKKYDIRFADQGRYSGYLIFPNYDEYGLLDYFTTRYVYAIPEFRPKSKNPPKGTWPSPQDIMFGEWCVDKYAKHAFLVEGPFDMLALAGESVALLGKEVSEAKAGLLAQRFRAVTLCLDKGVNIVKAAQRLRKVGLGVRSVTFPDDAAKYEEDNGPGSALEFAHANAKRVSDVDVLRRRLDDA